jgi:hypothetical protein
MVSSKKGGVLMNYTLRVSAIVLLGTVVLSEHASADFWVRVDHPWRNRDLDKAIAFCRMQPRVDSDFNLFVDLLYGQQIERCMHALGWVGVAR